MNEYRKRLLAAYAAAQADYKALGLFIESEEFKTLTYNERNMICDEHEALWELQKLREINIRKIGGAG